MKIKKEYLIGAGACFLCFLSAAVNVHFVRQFALAVGFLSGDIVRIFTEASSLSQDVSHLVTLCLIIFSFFCGAVVTGSIIHHPRFNLQRPYGRSMMAMGFGFLLAAMLEDSHVYLALPVAAFSAGMQNALATKYRGVILRTTHITGVVTDFGQSVGMRLAGNQLEPWKIWLHFFLFASFVVGVGAGFLFDHVSGNRGAFVVAPIYIVFGALFFVFKRKIGAFGQERSE